MVFATLPQSGRQRPIWPRALLATAVSLLRGDPAIPAPSRGPGTEALGYPFGLPWWRGKWHVQGRGCSNG